MKSTTTQSEVITEAEPKKKVSAQQEKTFRVVVAHFNEPLQWLPAIPKDYPITVSSAGETPEIPESEKSRVLIEKTVNAGKEAGQWIRWIAKHYDELEDVLIFLQGAPYKGHTPEILLNLKKDKINGPFDYFLGKKPYHKSVGKGEEYGELTWIVPPEYHVEPFSCSVWGAQHYVTKEIIHRRPVSFYKRLSDISLGHEQFANVCEHFFNVIYGVTIEEVQ